MKCVICQQPFGDGEFEGVSQYAAYGGLPSPCCGHCFEANDYSIKNAEQLQYKSLLRRHKHGDQVYHLETGEPIEVTETLIHGWTMLQEAMKAQG